MLSFNLLLQDSITVIESDKIPESKPTVLIFFSPDCEHCQQETEGLLKKMDAVKNIQFYFITEDPLDRMKIFTKYYQISRYSNIVVGRDYNFEFLNKLKLTVTPVTMLYNKDKRLCLTFKGPFPAETIIAEINKL